MIVLLIAWRHRDAFRRLICSLMPALKVSSFKSCSCKIFAVFLSRIYYQKENVSRLTKNKNETVWFIGFSRR